MKEKNYATTDNIFADLGLEDSEEMATRSDLMSEVVSLIRNSGLPQKAIAEILEISAPKVSALMTGKINDFSNDTLVHYLTLLGCNVEIRVLPQNHSSRPIKRGKLRVRKLAIKKRKKAMLR